MNDVKARVIAIVNGRELPVPEVVVAVPAEMTVEQAREVLDDGGHVARDRTWRDGAVIPLCETSTNLTVGYSSEDPTGYSGSPKKPVIKFKMMEGSNVFITQKEYFGMNQYITPVIRFPIL